MMIGEEQSNYSSICVSVHKIMVYNGDVVYVQARVLVLQFVWSGRYKGKNRACNSTIFLS